MKTKPSIGLMVVMLMFPQIVETIYSPALGNIAQSFAVTYSQAAQTLSIYFSAFALPILANMEQKQHEYFVDVQVNSQGIGRRCPTRRMWNHGNFVARLRTACNAYLSGVFPRFSKPSLEQLPVAIDCYKFCRNPTTYRWAWDIWST